MRINYTRMVICVLYKDNGELKLSVTKVKYIRDGEELEQFVGGEGKQWWLDFVEKWDHTEIIEFVDAEYTNEQLSRFDEVKNLAISEVVLEQYIANGTIGDGLELLALKNENKELEGTVMELTSILAILTQGGL